MSHKSPKMSESEKKKRNENRKPHEHIERQTAKNVRSLRLICMILPCTWNIPFR